MNESKESIFNIDEKLIDKILHNIIAIIKREWKFFFGFFIGVMVIILLT